MRLSVSILGYEVFTVEFGQPVEEEVEEEVEAADDDEDARPKWLGLSACNSDIERDYSPLSPDDRYDWEWEDRRRRGFGFQ